MRFEEIEEINVAMRHVTRHREIILTRVLGIGAFGALWLFVAWLVGVI